jgi:hypothetical protein
MIQIIVKQTIKFCYTNNGNDIIYMLKRKDWILRPTWAFNSFIYEKQNNGNL